jgi:hypothetical protein
MMKLVPPKPRNRKFRGRRRHPRRKRHTRRRRHPRRRRLRRLQLTYLLPLLVVLGD